MNARRQTPCNVNQLFNILRHMGGDDIHEILMALLGFEAWNELCEDSLHGPMCSGWALDRTIGKVIQMGYTYADILGEIEMNARLYRVHARLIDRHRVAVGVMSEAEFAENSAIYDASEAFAREAGWI